MFLKKLSILLLCYCTFQQLKGQELSAIVSLQTNKVDNQVDPKFFTQLQTQLKDFINQRKWTSDIFTQEEKIDCSFYITIESLVSPGALLSRDQVEQRAALSPLPKVEKRLQILFK